MTETPSSADARFLKLFEVPAAVLDLSDRGLLRVTGSDRVRFLNGMLTTDVAALGAGGACASLQLDRKGHVLALLTVLAFEERLDLDVTPGADAALAEILEKHLIADDVEIANLGAEHGMLSVEGPGSAEALRAIDVDVPEPGACAESDWRGAGYLWIGGGALTDSGVRAIAAPASIRALRDVLSLPLIESEQLEVMRVENLEPLLGVDVGERNFPQEARLESAVSFTKGCYIGQEIVARIASRGAVNRLLVQIALTAEAKPGDEIRVGDKSVGALTSAVVSPSLGPLALGYVKKAEAEPGTQLEVGGRSARVLGPRP